MFQIILSEIYDRENKHSLGRQQKALKTIDMLSDRIMMAKSLLLDKNIDFKEYKRIKEDLESKIGMLGDTLASYQRHQSGINEKINRAVLQFSQLNILFFSLKEEYQYDFIRRMLVKKCIWSNNTTMSILNGSAQFVCGEDLSTTCPEEGNENMPNPKLFLQLLADIVFKNASDN